MIPRYWPALDLAAGFAPMSASGAEAAASAFVSELGVAHAATVVPVPSARVGLASYFAGLADRDSRRVVVMSAQICPLVPRLLLPLGYRPFFVDVAAGMSAAGYEETMRGYEAAGGVRDVAAVIVAPMYGHLPENAERLATALDDTAVVVDMAQGILLGGAIPSLLRRADATVYSFGMGKGLDTRGAVLALRRKSENFRQLGTLRAFLWLADVPQILALRAAVGLGVYRYLLSAVENELEAQKVKLPFDGRGPCPILPRTAFNTWNARLQKFRDEVALARRRAGELFARPAIARCCRDGAIFGGEAGVHLRQIIRLNDATKRDDVVSALRRDGIDAMPAGESMPHEYLETVSAAPGENFQNTHRFRADAIRLPFLGRLSEKSFQRVATVVEGALERLS